MKFKPMTVALYTGFFVSALHLLWSLMVALGVGQVYLDWILGLHFIKNPFVVMPFDLSTMLVLVVFTFVVGFILGWVGTICWNKMVKK
jgi:hypothetical protein